MFFTRLAVQRPVTTLMACLMVLLLGGVALSRLTVDLMPDITYPTVSVVTLYRGAGPEEVETRVTRPLEQALGSVSGVDRLASTSAEGSSTIRVRLQWGTNVDAAVSDMRESIQKIREQLPEDIEEPFVRSYDVSDSPIMYLGLASDMQPVELTQLAERTIMPRLERLPGVARVGLRGGTRREIHVELDRTKLESLDMGVNEVVASLKTDNVSQPAGDFDEGNLKLLIRSQGEFVSLDQIGASVVRERDDAVVRIRDIATVIDGIEERTELSRVNGQPAVMVYIFRQAGSNTIEVSDAVQTTVTKLNSELDNASLTVRFDKSLFIRQAIENVRTSAIFGMGLAIIVLILFLRSFRSTLVIGISIPLSVLATFVFIYFQGFTLNMVSFGGLALGIGLLVDNSIVVLESIFRKRDEGLDPQAAAIEGTQEVSSAIVASTLTTLIVFVPLLFISGMTGIMLHQLAWVVSSSLLCSLFASLTLTPVLAATWILREHSPEQTAFPLRWARGFSGLFHGVSRFLFDLVENAYAWILRGSLRFPGAVGCGLLMLLAITFGLIPRIGSEYMPKADEGLLRIYAQMAPGIQLETLDRQTRILEETVIKHVPEAVVTSAFIGDEADDAEDWNESRFFVYLKPRGERKRSIADIRKDLAGQIGPIPGMKVRIQASNEMMIFRMLSSRGSRGGDVEVQVRGYDLRTADELATAIEDIMQDIPGLVNVEVEREDLRPELAASIDRAQAGLLGVSVKDISQALETTIRGTEATVFREDGDEFNILVRLQESDRNRLTDVEQVGVSTPNGRIVPLKTVVTFDHGQAPLAINRLDQQRIIGITADVEDRDLGSIISELQTKLKTVPVPNEFSLTIAGDWEEQQKSFKALMQGFVLAIILMYMVMASQFESLRDPLLILVTIPLGGIGVILVFVYTNTTLNVQSFIGVVMLAGIVVNNAIVLIDYMNQLRASDETLTGNELILHAAVRRFRPIIMTTATTVLAMLPIALGWGDGGELQAPMARVVIGGLLSGTLITLLAIPLVYRFVHGKELAK
jgi:HAE1 family hydrophobic/amphiphilic exporter-1